jgi:hypothetical protein
MLMLDVTPGSSRLTAMTKLQFYLSAQSKALKGGGS